MVRLPDACASVPGEEDMWMQCWYRYQDTWDIRYTRAGILMFPCDEAVEAFDADVQAYIQKQLADEERT